ncbi:hypothetical protein [uncultured Lacinutrix sp.]|uniref:hypothetical protein n=1 Tax=uncultured Lacinutrix sp. TaxID=574032 RepID=UPI00261F265B|nr:hypothetical protein [uncultured Lacinutrix sp.]
MKHLFSTLMALLTITVLSCASCSKDDSPITNPTTTINPGSDPNFTIVANNDGVLSNFNRKVVVFGIDIYAVSGVTDTNLLHAANLLAQYLDNNEDGTIDNQAVIDAMLANKAYMVMWANESDLNNAFIDGRIGQDLGNDETHPNFVANGRTGEFDAALEEVWHIVTHAGHESAYPNVFGTQIGSAMSNAMDIARGGQFTTIPNPYPSNAWYSYDDQTCDYECQAGEYIYWVMSSMLGAQEFRLNEIDNEWTLNTPALIQSGDTAAYALLSDPQYKFPTVLPDGTYRQ